MNKNKEIALLQKEQKALKKEIVDIKKKLPNYIVGFVLLTFVCLYFLEEIFYNFFGSSIDIIKAGIVISGIICLFFIYMNSLTIKKKKKQAKLLGTKLFNIMKLDKQP